MAISKSETYGIGLKKPHFGTKARYLGYYLLSVHVLFSGSNYNPIDSTQLQFKIKIIRASGLNKASHNFISTSKTVFSGVSHQLSYVLKY